MISLAISEAYASLAADGDVDIRAKLTADGTFGSASFVLRFELPYPNSAGLPPAVDVKARIPSQFPFAKVELSPVDPCLRGFAHQDVRTGEICLPPVSALGPSDQLRTYVEAARKWFDDAAHGNLLVDGEPWELPDFRVDRKDRPPSVYVLESEQSFDWWRDRIGHFGAVQFVRHVHGQGLVAARFVDPGRGSLEPVVGEGFLKRRDAALGTWILLPSHVVYRHRGARTFRELESMCRGAGVDLWGALKRALKARPAGGFHYVLVGAPIPRTVGGGDTEVHWQPVAIPRQFSGPFVPGSTSRPRTATEQKAFRARMQGTMLDQHIPWGEVTNVSHERLTQRGALDEGLQTKRVCLLGCGAIGSAIAEHLSRGGARDLALFDNQTLELENLVRHTLAGPEIGQSKALALAKRLTGIHSLAHVRGFAASLPLEEHPPKANRQARAVFDAANVYIDCTADEPVFRWLSRIGRREGRLVIHVFMNAHARLLTICASGRHASCAKVVQKLVADVWAEHTPVSWKEYQAGAEEIRPGAGCWHPTFPARGADVAALVAAAVPVLEHLISRDRTSQGMAVVLRRKDLPRSADGAIDLAAGTSLVDIVWSAPYR